VRARTLKAINNLKKGDPLKAGTVIKLKK
jgi:hypothetical protein